MQGKKGWLSFALAIILISTVFYFYTKSQQPLSPPGVIYNTHTQEWENAKTEPHIVREDIVKGDNDDGLHNDTLLRGYFDSYNEAANVLTIKSIMPFTNNNKLEIVDLQLSPNQSIYCAPPDFTDLNTGKTYLMKSLTFPVKDNELISVLGEQLTTLDNLLERSNDLTYVLIQLTSDFDTQATNYVQKLIALDICE